MKSNFDNGGRSNDLCASLLDKPLPQNNVNQDFGFHLVPLNPSQLSLKSKLKIH